MTSRKPIKKLIMHYLIGDGPFAKFGPGNCLQISQIAGVLAAHISPTKGTLTRCISKAVAELQANDDIAVHYNDDRAYAIALPQHVAECDKFPSKGPEMKVTVNSGTNLARRRKTAEELTLCLLDLQKRYDTHDHPTSRQVRQDIADLLDITVANAWHKLDKLKKVGAVIENADKICMVKRHITNITVDMLLDTSTPTASRNKDEINQTEVPPIAKVSDMNEVNTRASDLTWMESGRLLFHEVTELKRVLQSVRADLEMETAAKQEAIRLASEAKSDLDICKSAHADLQTAHAALIHQAEEVGGVTDRLLEEIDSLKKQVEAATRGSQVDPDIVDYLSSGGVKTLTT